MGGGNFSGCCVYSFARYCHLRVRPGPLPGTHTRREFLQLPLLFHTYCHPRVHHTHKEGTPPAAALTCCCLHAPHFPHLPNKHFLFKDVQLQAQLDQQSLSQQVTETQEGLISLEFREG